MTAFLAIFLLAGFAETKAQNLHHVIRFRVLDGNGHSDETVIRLKEEASQGFDTEWDAVKRFSPDPSVPSIYSVSGNMAYAINAQPPLGKNEEMTVGIEIREGSSPNLFLEYEVLGPFNASLALELVDEQLKAVYQLQCTERAVSPRLKVANRDSESKIARYRLVIRQKE